MKSLDQLQKEGLPRLDWRTLFKHEGLSAEDEQAMDAYFFKFAQPGPCLRCGAKQGSSEDSALIDALMGRAMFRWGLAHGEGFCSNKGCGYPARALHYDVGPIKRVSLILQYHPDELHQKQ